MIIDDRHTGKSAKAALVLPGRFLDLTCNLQPPEEFEASNCIKLVFSCIF